MLFYVKKFIYIWFYIKKTKKIAMKKILFLTFIGGMAYMVKANELVIKKICNRAWGYPNRGYGKSR